MFDNIVKVAWPENEERNMILLEDISFIDKSGKKWTAYKGESINGASIPSIFWSIFGSPYIGKYRRPSVIHDVYCGRKTESYVDVHKVFNEMLEYDGVKYSLRIKMFKAVWYFGPKWDIIGGLMTAVPPIPSNDICALENFLNDLPCPSY